MNDKMVLITSGEAATYRTDISGWVSRIGRFWGADEQMARRDGCTHVLCGCGEPVEKTRIKCAKCWAADSDKRFAALEKKPWDGKTPLCIWDDDRYFWDEHELIDYCEELGLNPRELQLVICEPVYAQEIDPDEYYEDLLPDDEGRVEDALWNAFEELNEIIREDKFILSWRPGKYAAVLTWTNRF